MNQLNIFEQAERVRSVEEPYRNIKGELLPWEEPEYIATMNNTNEIERLEAKLAQMRLDYVKASPSYKKYLEVGGKLIKHKVELLKKSQLEDNQLKL